MSRIALPTVLVVLIGALMPAGLAGQQPTPKPAAPAAAQPPAPPPQSTSPISQTDYVVGQQDVMKITVFNEPTLSNTYRVDNDGSISFPFLGRVKVAGLRVAVIEAQLAKSLAEGYIKNPQVTVDMEQYRSQSVFIMGEVRVPSKYSLVGNSSLMEALMQAGWVTPTAGFDVLIIHPRSGATRAVLQSELQDINADVTRVNLRDIEAGKLPQNIRIQDGDTILVPKALRLTVLGQVRTPGSIVYEPGMTIQAAIAQAGGQTEKGSIRRVKIIRIENNARKEVDAELTDLVQPNDIVQVNQRLF
jgi:polysaccharide export outer membrane protein